jgi:hypothetical protein
MILDYLRQVSQACPDLLSMALERPSAQCAPSRLQRVYRGSRLVGRKET